uniref:Uncharacterized protein n=1 Tax=Cyanothece sp. (strain PCC 7425 / ATCC 29141) TaxID=395961 RepID=B8HR08_CYAP4
MNTKHILSIVALLTLMGEGFSPAAYGQNRIKSTEVITLTEINCREFLKMDSDEQDLMLTFLHGFINGKTNQTTIDVPKLTQASDAIVDYCISNPQTILISVVDQIRQGK